MIYNKTRVALASYRALQQHAQLAPKVDEDSPSYEQFDRPLEASERHSAQNTGSPIVGLEQMSPSKIEWEMQCALNIANRG